MPHDTRRSYDAVAEDYADRISDELDGKPLDRALLEAITELADGGVIADIGCGPGHVARHLRRRNTRTIALDLSPAMATIANRNTPAAAADMTALPIKDNHLAVIVALYAVIHLDERQRAAAYREFARTLQPGGSALIAFHTSDAEFPTGGAQTFTQWWSHDVALTFRYLDPELEIDALNNAGLTLTAHLARQPAGDEHPSRRSYLVVRRPPPAP